MFKVFFASDLHGSERCFRKFVNAGKHYGADVLICGGDITGKMIVPIVERGDGTYSACYFGSEVVVRSQVELEALEANVRSAGFYAIRTTEERMRSLGEAEVEQLFAAEMRQTLRGWIALAEERLRGSGIPCFMMPGNDDIHEIDDILDSSDYVVNADDKVVKVGQHEMISLGCSNLTPWLCPRDVPEEEVAARIERLVARVEDVRSCIFNFHCPPYDSQLDYAPQLDENFRPRMQGSDFKMIPVGSTAVREAIERYQPFLALHGHIHEGRGVSKIGRTLCINPGSEYQQGVLRGVFMAINDRGQVNWAFTSG